MQPPRPRLSSQAAGWAARAVILLGGVGLALRVGLPAPAAGTPGADEEAFGERTAQGAPGTPPSRKARLAHHETSDMSGRLMARLVAGLGVTAAILVVGVVVVQRLVVGRFERVRAPLTAEQQIQAPPPKPNLQSDPMTEIMTLHARENGLLDHYAWIDTARTRGRIPIARAMALVIGKPLDTAP